MVTNFVWREREYKGLSSSFVGFGSSQVLRFKVKCETPKNPNFLRKSKTIISIEKFEFF